MLNLGRLFLQLPQLLPSTTINIFLFEIGTQKVR